ncbi:OmpA family protein [Roseivivax sediminis]|uniref:Outer membrane protein OmpA n=1 Tax=Roseivivax sediminis TaxID=936889 RepID=A0A1I1V4F1_9RHOB|nr:OmpA family protein [Roseivivax sediminis]SFD77911.1 Outer membrane protein OmpA [Roseivivax sediminis]
MHIRPAIIAFIVGALCGPAIAQSAKTYADGSDGTVTLPMGDLSFADSALRYEMGNPAPIEPSRDPRAAIGPPDWESLDTPERELTLGCGGSVVLRFEDNALIDIEGTDLYVFEVGPDVEPTFLAISADGETWTDIGDISGGRADVDIAPYVAQGASFSHVRLTDDGEECSGRWPGADIDAVAAIGTAERFVLSGEVLFEFDSASLRDSAREALNATAEAIGIRALSEVRVVGHTDSRGADDYNRQLSLDRAQAVRDWLSTRPELQDVTLTTSGAGESQPTAGNDTEAGRRQNRRVELIAVPTR